MAALPERRRRWSPRPFRVERRVRETYDTWTLSLAPVQGEQLEVGPGQFTMLYAFGVGEVPISVSGAPLVQTIRAVGPVTRALCASRPGTVVGVRGPFGTSWPVEQAKGSDLLIVAGGVGLPPVRPALYHALAHRADYGRVILLYGARTPDDIVFRKEIERWRSRMDLEVDVTVDAAADGWRGKVGVVTTLIPRAGIDPDSTAAFVVGPEIMMRFTARALVDEGLPAERIWISMERSMKCGVALCGHCQFGPSLICRDGAVYPVPGDRAVPGGEGAVREAEARRLEVLVVRRLPALAARLRGRAARGRGRRRHRLLPGGDQQDGRRPVRRLARRGLDHHPARRRADPRGPPQVEGADHDRRLRHGRRDPGAPELRRRGRVRLDRLRLARVHLHPGHLDGDRRPRVGRLRAARLPDRQGPAAGGRDRVPARAPAERAGLLGVHGVQAPRDHLRHGCSRDAVPRAGHAGRLRRDLPGVRARLLRLLRPDGDAEHGVALEAAARPAA